MADLGATMTLHVMEGGRKFRAVESAIRDLQHLHDVGPTQPRQPTYSFGFSPAPAARLVRFSLPLPSIPASNRKSATRETQAAKQANPKLASQSH
uniref:Uncharacterized protein n=1 Tax=Oryza barthii TaxID=65489 RepID=A0A0D3EWV5_9ORYZ